MRILAIIKSRKKNIKLEKKNIFVLLLHHRLHQFEFSNQQNDSNPSNSCEWLATAALAFFLMQEYYTCVNDGADEIFRKYFIKIFILIFLLFFYFSLFSQVGWYVCTYLLLFVLHLRQFVSETWMFVSVYNMNNSSSHHLQQFHHLQQSAPTLTFIVYLRFVDEVLVQHLFV